MAKPSINEVDLWRPLAGIIPKDSTDQEAVISTFPNRSWFQCR